MIFIGARFAVIHPILALATFNSQRRLDVRARHTVIVGLLRLKRRLLGGYSLFSALAQAWTRATEKGVYSIAGDFFYQPFRWLADRQDRG